MNQFDVTFFDGLSSRGVPASLSFEPSYWIVRVTRDDGSVDRGIEGRRVASGRQDSYTPHGLAPLESNSKTTYINFERETPDELPDPGGPAAPFSESSIQYAGWCFRASAGGDAP